MLKKFVNILLSFSVFSIFSAYAAIDTTWLVEQQNADGSFSAQNDISLQEHVTFEALQTLYITGDINLIDENLAIQIIDASDDAHLENLVRKIHARRNAGRDTNELIVKLKKFINEDGGFAGIVGYQSTVLDTALAVNALAVSGGLLDNDFSYAVGFLISRQSADGSWSSDGNASSVYITAIVSRALQASQLVFDVTSNINNANNFLLAYLQDNLSSTEVFETALAVTAIAPVTIDKTGYQFLVDQLTLTRNTDGSWAQDIYTTSLAMRALQFAETGVPADRSLIPVVLPSATISAVAGVVTDSLSGQALAGASINISLADGTQANVLSGPEGRYVISQLLPGNATITVSLSGYHSVTATPVLSPGVVQYFNPVLLIQPQPVPVNIKGTLIDIDTNLPLANATIQVLNSAIATQTSATGDFQLNNLSPGSITLQISNDGYISRSYAISAALGGDINLGLIPLKSGLPTGNTGTITGFITEAVSGQALNGVSVTLSGADNKTAFTDVGGRFSITDVNLGNINITAALSGFTSAIATSEIIAGTDTHFTAEMVKLNDQAQVTLQGSIIDSQTQQPLSGVTIQIAQQALSIQSAANGQFQLGNISPGSFNVVFSLSGYNSLTYTVTASGGALLNMGQIELSVNTPVSANRPPVITSTAPVSAQVGVTYRYAIQATDADNDTITYGFLDRPDGMLIDSSTGIITWQPTMAHVGTQSFSVLAFDNQGGRAQEVASVNVLLSGSDIYVITDTQTLQGIQVQSTVPSNFSLGRYLAGARPDFQFSSPACPLANGTGSVSTDVSQIAGTLERLTTDRSLSVMVGAGEGTTTGPDLIMDLNAPQDTVVVFPSVDHVPFPEEGIEYTVWGADDPAAIFPDGWALATLVSIYTEGYVESSACVDQDETDDYAGLYRFKNAYQYIRVRAANSISLFKTPAHTDWTIADDNGSEPGWQSIEAEIDSVGAMNCSVKPVASAGVDILGQTGQPIQFDASPTPGNIVTYGWDLDNDNEIDLTGVNPTHIFNAGFDQDVTLFAVDNLGCVGIDKVRVTIDLNFPEPDLIVDAFSVSGISTNLQTLQVSGSAQVSIKNSGLAPAPDPALVSVFEDTNLNGIFDIGIDNVLGSITLPAGLARNDALNVSVPVNGTVNFRDSPLYTMVDSDAKIEESDEANNTDTTLSQCRGAVNTPQQIVLKEKWRWDGSVSGILNSAANVYGPAIVGQLNDDNGDGVITVEDIPDTLFYSLNSTATAAVLRAISGADGNELWSTNSRSPTGFGSLALGDIDNDGQIEIVGINIDRTEIFAYEHTGELKWFKPTGPFKAIDGPRDAIAIADLDHDGLAEIIHGRRVYSQNGDLKWEGSADYGGRPDYGFIPIAANVDNAGDMEVIAGRTLYDANGNIIWHQDQATADGFNAVGNFDNDDFAEIVLVTSGQVYLLEHTGEIIWGPVNLPGGPVTFPEGGFGGPPTVADFDGDGKPEIGVAGSNFYIVLETNGAIKWTTPIQDITSGRTGSSMFDFELDGQAEILYADEINFYIFDGATGDVRLKLSNISGTTFEYPVIVDIDNDNQAEIIVSQNRAASGNGIRVFESAQGTWAPTRSIWNQHSYHIDNINDDGTIPQNEASSWLTHNSYRLNTFADGSAASLADITASLLTVNNTAGQPAGISVRIGNGGELSLTQPVNISFYEGSPTTDATLLGSVTINSLASGAYQDVVLNNIPALSGNKDIVVVADANNSVSECNELNNTVNLPVFAGSASAALNVDTPDTQYIAGTQIPLQGVVTNNSAIPGQFLTQLQIEDAQSNVIQVFAQQGTGIIAGQSILNIADTWDSSGFLAGAYQLRGRLFDEQGEELSSATSSFTLSSIDGQATTSLRTTTDKPQYHTSDRVQIDNLVGNISTDTIINGATLRITVASPDNETVFTQEVSLSSMAAGNQRLLAVEYSFIGEPEGTYRVNAQLLSPQNNVLINAQASYIVKSDTSLAIVGQSRVQTPALDRGQPQVCTDTVQNAGSLNLTALTVQQTLLEVNSKQLLQTQTQLIDLVTGSNQTLVRNINTSTLNAGDYVCAIQTRINGEIRLLDFAAFTVTEPPVQVVGDINIGSRGQLLVWLGDHHKYHDIKDQKQLDAHYQTDTYIDLNAQRVYLEALLQEAGWEYTLVDHRSDFIKAFNTGEYQAYLLLHADEKLSIALEKALREAVYRGEGLIVSTRRNPSTNNPSTSNPSTSNPSTSNPSTSNPSTSNPSTSNPAESLLEEAEHIQYNALADALGIQVLDYYASSNRFDFVQNNPLELTGSVNFSQSRYIQGITLKQAQSVLQYKSTGCKAFSHHAPEGGMQSGNAGNRNGVGSKNDTGQECDASHQLLKSPHPHTAVSFNQYGQGRALYAGFDLLAYAASYQDKTLLTELIKQALTKTHPSTIVLSPSNVIPIEVSTNNQGNDAVTNVSLTAPVPTQWVRAVAGSINNQQALWQYPLAAGDSRNITAWAKLPATGGNTYIQMLIEAGLDSANLIEQQNSSLNIQVAARPLLADIIAQIDALLVQNTLSITESKRLKLARSWLIKALKNEQAGQLFLATSEALLATDQLTGIVDQSITVIRLQIDQWLRLAPLQNKNQKIKG